MTGPVHDEGRSLVPRLRFMRSASITLMSLGAAIVFVLYLKPWASCAESETPAGCPTTAPETLATQVGFGSFLAGAALLAVWVTLQSRRSA